MISALLSAQTFGWAKPRRLLVNTIVIFFINNKYPYHDRDKGLKILNIFVAILHQFDCLYVHINEKSGPRIMKQSYYFKVKYFQLSYRHAIEDIIVKRGKYAILKTVSL